MRDTVQKRFEGLLGILNLWISTVMFNILLGFGKCYHSKEHVGLTVFLL